jgi:hypothetical protein
LKLITLPYGIEEIEYGIYIEGTPFYMALKRGRRD